MRAIGPRRKRVTPARHLSIDFVASPTHGHLVIRRNRRIIGVVNVEPLDDHGAVVAALVFFLDAGGDSAGVALNVVPPAGDRIVVSVPAPVLQVRMHAPCFAARMPHASHSGAPPVRTAPPAHDSAPNTSAPPRPCRSTDSERDTTDRPNARCLPSPRAFRSLFVR